MKKNAVVISFLSVLLLGGVVRLVIADTSYLGNIGLYSLDSLDGKDGWSVTNYYGNESNSVLVTPGDGQGTNYIEMANHDSMIVTRSFTPLTSGVFQVRMKHNKKGSFYLYGLTSDAGGQLLFSIQFTESRGILLEEGDRQITLLSDYNPDQWYLFTIDFDKSRGKNGTLKVKIDDGDYQEYEYVDSESTIFDFAQVVFGSDNQNGTAISGFGDAVPLITQATSTPVTP